MDFTKIFIFQKTLDSKFEESIKQRNVSMDVLEWHKQVTLAIIVEIAEFANELQSFKYWKQNRNINNEKLLEEWADIIHFLSSCANNLNLNPIIKKTAVSADINIQLQNVFKAAVDFQTEFNSTNLSTLFSLILGFLDILNIKEEMLINAYFKKAEINLKRIKEKY
ncbi:dUTP diphosphatase [Mycoplasma sp. 480]|uniref:dUTP diphosphatase n=1 Tax=Mycoplasma sp. 480 TaxID=3440155 RepID=UPI003F517AE8